VKISEFTTVEPSVQDEIDYVEANFREGERAEHEVFGGKRTTLADFESCWTVRHRGEIIGYFGVAIPAGATVFAPGRWLCYMSCKNADKYKLTYVKESRKVMKCVVAQVPGYVTEFRSLPAERYVMSVKWHERVLKMRRIGTVDFNGERFAVFGIMRKEIGE